MKCPYAVNTKIVTKIGFKYDDNGLPVTQTAIEGQKVMFPECIKRECAAWHDGAVGIMGERKGGDLISPGVGLCIRLGKT